MAQRRGEPEIGRLQPASGGKRDRAPLDILAGMAAVGAFFKAGLHRHPAIREDAILLHHHRVGARGHRRAGKDADRLAAFDVADERMPRRGAPGHRQHRVAVGLQIGMGDGIAVDRAVGVRRQIHTGDEILRQNAACGLSERHGLRLDHRCHPLGDQRQGGVDAQQRPAKGKAIVAQLRHQSGPGWARMKSAIAEISASDNRGNGTPRFSSEATATICGSSG